MRNYIICLFILKLAIVPLFGQDCTTIPPSDNKVYPWCFTPNVGTNWDTQAYKPYIINGMRFRLLYPPGYNSNSGTSYPLVIFLHGLGQHGTDNNLQLKIGGINHLKAVEEGKYKGFIMVPQADSEFWAGYEKPKILAFIQHAINNLQVDPLRVQVEGYSAGADMAWKLATENPLVFASVSVMSYARASTAEADAQLFRYKAVWHSQGGRDTQPSPAAGNRVAAAFKSQGSNYRYKYYPELGHGTWFASYAEKEFFPFLNTGSMLNIHARYFKYNFCAGEKVEGTMGIQAGFEGYEWRKDGQPLTFRTNEIAFTALGSYTVRLKRAGTWSAWSEPLKIQRVGASAKPTITADGPVALPTPDGKSTVTLYAPAGKQAYLWSTGATAESIEVSQGGSYSVSVTEAYGCPSPYSDPIRVTFNAVGTLTAPSNLVVVPKSATQLSLIWKDNSNNESGFELYHSTGPNGPWQLALQTSANSTQATDNGLLPGTRYFYKIRAVNSSGGSSYLLGNGKTQADALAPSIPQNLSVGATTNSSISLHWQASSDNASPEGQIEYELYANDSFHIATTRNTYYTVKGLPQKKHYRFKVRARDAQNNASAFSNQLSAGTYLNGLAYTYYEGEITTVNDISLLSAKTRGRVANFTISPKESDNFYAIVYEGSLRIPTNGVYTFFTKSKDGSILSLNGQQLVFNDSEHSVQERSGTIELAAGVYPIKLAYFEGYGEGELLEVRWKGPSFELQTIADSLFTEPIPGLGLPAAPAGVGLKLNELNGVTITWNSPTDGQVEIYRAVQGIDNDYILLRTVSAKLGQFTDSEVSSGKTLAYTLRATDASGESAYTDKDKDGKPLTIKMPANILGVPTKVSATKQSSESAVLYWADNSAGESGFEIWRNDNGQGYKKIATVVANAVSYTDANLSNLSGVAYRLRAVMGNTFSDWSQEASLNTNNAAPIISGLPNVVRAKEGELTEVAFQLSDPEGKKLNLYSQFLPHFATLTITSNSQAKLVLNPSASDVGLYPNIQITASDSLLEADWVFTIQVIHSLKVTTYINLGSGGAASPWNNIASLPQASDLEKQTIGNEFGEETTYRLTGSGWEPSRNWGATAGKGNERFPARVSQSALFVAPGNSAEITLTGLQQNKLYNLVFFGSSIYKSFNGATIYTVGSESAHLNVQDNIEKTTQLNGLRPDSEGSIKIIVKGAENATKGGFLNALLVEEYTDNKKLLRPERLSVRAKSTTAVSLNWEDNSVGEKGFELWQRQLPNGSFSLVANLPANTTHTAVSKLLEDTGYEYKVRASGSSGYSDYSEIRSVATLQYEVLVNANFTLNMGKPWNNLDRKPVTGDAWYNFKDTENSNTGINLVVLQNFDGDNPFGPDAQSKGLYHDNVIKTFYYTEVGTTARLQLYGLNDELTYSFRFMGASAFPGGEGGSTRYTIGNKSASLDAELNIENTVSIYDVVPESGKITIEIEADNFARYGFLNAMEIEAYDTGKEQQEFDFNKLLASDPSVVAEAKGGVLSVYPNPTYGNISVVLTVPATSNYTVFLYDVSGRQIFAETQTLQAGKTSFAINLEGEPVKTGLYFIRVNGPGYTSQVTRVIKAE